MSRILFIYGTSKERRHVAPGASFRLYGSDVANAYGHDAITDIAHNACIDTSPVAKVVDAILNCIMRCIGGYGGKWVRVLRTRSLFSDSDLVISTVDRIGIPLVVLMALGFMPRRPLLYISVGLPERLRQMRPRFRAWFIRAVNRHTKAIVCYGFEEAEQLRDLFGSRVHFVPFGVDIHYFSPCDEPREEEPYVVTVGADPHRDYETLFKAAAQFNMPWRIITTQTRYEDIREHGSQIPKNISFLFDVPLEKVKKEMTYAAAVVLPLKNNSYSGGTTVLLQAMALGKPVVVTKVNAIKDGYHLQDQKNCLLVEPGDTDALVEKMRYVSDVIGKKARETAVAHFSWKRYCDDIYAVIKMIIQ